MQSILLDDSPHEDADFAWHLDLSNGDRTLWPCPLSVRWSDDGSRVLVVRTIDPRFSPLLDAARPDIGAVVAIAAVVCLLIGIARILRRPRASGRQYCRRCNHDVHAAHGEQPSSSLCPECGATLSGRGTVVGRTRLRRLTTIGVPLIAAASLGVATFVSSVHISSMPVGAFNAWPLPDAARFAGWPFWRRDAMLDRDVFSTQLDVIRVEPDGLRLDGSIQQHGGADWIARSDGHLLAWTEFSKRTDWNPRVNWYDAVADRAGFVDLGAASAGFPSVCGWSPDGQEIVAVLTHLDATNPTLREDKSAVADVDVFVVNPETNAVRVVDRSRGFAREVSSTGTRRNWTIGLAIAAVGSDPRFRTVTLCGEQVARSGSASSGRAAIRELTVTGDDGTRIIALSGTSRPDALAFHQASIEADGRLRLEFATYYPHMNPGCQGCPVWMIDLETGAVDTSPSAEFDRARQSADAISLSPDGTKRVRLELGNPPVITGRLSGVRIIVEPGVKK